MMEWIKNILDLLSLGTIGAVLLQWLPAIAALFTIVWTAIRIFTEWPKLKVRLREVFR